MHRIRRVGCELVFGEDTQLAGHADDRCSYNTSAPPDAYTFTERDAVGPGHADSDAIADGGTIAASNDDSQIPWHGDWAASLSDHCPHQ